MGLIFLVQNLMFYIRNNYIKIKHHFEQKWILKEVSLKHIIPKLYYAYIFIR